VKTCPWILPCQFHATRNQFERSSQEVEALRARKRSVDPAGRLKAAVHAKKTRSGWERVKSKTRDVLKETGPL
jgi:hypothetical protein